jgi:hypothetical protein
MHSTPLQVRGNSMHSTPLQVTGHSMHSTPLQVRGHSMHSTPKRPQHTQHIPHVPPCLKHLKATKWADAFNEYLYHSCVSFLGPILMNTAAFQLFAPHERRTCVLYIMVLQA